MKQISLIFLLLLIFSCQKQNQMDEKTFLSQLNILTLKKNIILQNILNINTTRTEKGGPYIPVEAINCKGIGCDITPLMSKGIGSNKNIPRGSFLKYEPNHPDSNSKGYVAYPNINLDEERQKLARVKMAIQFLLAEMPVKKSFFFSTRAQKILKSYPAVDSEYNFKKLIEE